jgi:hypothetical protein
MDSRYHVGVSIKDIKTYSVTYIGLFYTMWGRSVVTEGDRITVLRGICGPRTARNGSALHTTEFLNVHPASNKDRPHNKLQCTIYILGSFRLRPVTGAATSQS